MTNQITPQLRAALLGIGLCATLLTGCGGGSQAAAGPTATQAKATATGVFTDAPVAGIAYSATPSGTQGTTDAQGRFLFAPGDSVTFTAAGVTLGSAAPAVTSSGAATVTPLSLVPGATAVTDPTVTAIGQLLATLNGISVQAGSGSSGVFVMPTGSQVQAFAAALDAQATKAGQLAAALTSGTVTAALPTGVGVVSATNAQSNLTQGIAAASYIGSVWSGTCTCGGGGYFYMQPDGTLAGFTDTGNLLSGSWGANPASGGLVFTLVSSGGGFSQGGTISGTSGTATITKAGGAVQGTLTINEVTSTATLTNTQYLGGWYATYTPNATGTSNGQSAGGAYFVAAPDGNIYGITDGGNNFTGTWSPATGIGTVTSSINGGTVTATLSIDLAGATGTMSVGGASWGSLAFARSGSLSLNSHSGGGASTPIDLSVQVNWPTNVGNVTSSFALSLTVNDSAGKPVANSVKSETNALGAGAQAWQMTDNIAASYPLGSGLTYQLSVGPANCTITNPSGNVCTSSCGAASYPTVTVTCH